MRLGFRKRVSKFEIDKNANKYMKAEKKRYTDRDKRSKTGKSG